MSDKTYNKPPWIKTGRRTRAMRSAKKQKNMELRDKRRAEGRYNWTHGFWDDLSKERQIEVLENPAKYLAAKNRVTAHKDRIRKKG